MVHFGGNKPTPTLFRLQRSRAGGLATAACQLIITPFSLPAQENFLISLEEETQGASPVSQESQAESRWGWGRCFCKGRGVFGCPEETDPGGSTLGLLLSCPHTSLEGGAGFQRWSKGYHPSTCATFGSKEKKGKARSQGRARGKGDPRLPRGCCQLSPAYLCHHALLLAFQWNQSQESSAFPVSIPYLSYSTCLTCFYLPFFYPSRIPFVEPSSMSTF